MVVFVYFAGASVSMQWEQEGGDTLWSSGPTETSDMWRRRLVFPVATGCEPGQVRKEAAAAAPSGAGIGLAGAVSNFSSDIVRYRRRILAAGHVMISIR